MSTNIREIISRLPVQKNRIVVFVGLFAGVGTIVMLTTLAATSGVAFEVENGSVTGNAVKVTGDASTSGGGYVKFGGQQYPSPGKLNGHDVVVDSTNKIISWLSQDTAYDQFIRLGWEALFRLPKDANGIPRDLNLYSVFDPDTFRGGGMNDVGEKNPPFVEAALRYYAYSGDKRAMDLVSAMLSYEITNGTTSASANWPSVPYGSADGGSTTFRGYSAGSGTGYIETDKVGDIGDAYLKMYEYTGDTKFRDAAINAANALTSHIRTGTATKSPWPWRVSAQDNTVAVDYTANVVGTLRLYDGLIRLNLGNVAGYTTARQSVLTWMLNFPMKNNAWSNYFNDDNNAISRDGTNYDQFSPMEAALYLMDNPQVDTNWQTDVRNLVKFVENTFVNNTPEPAVQFGANTVAEQIEFLFKTTSATARYASVNARLYELTGDVTAQQKAYRSLNWSTYMMLDNGGAVAAGVNSSTDWWWTDGYSDPDVSYHISMSAAPEWAPPGQNHMLNYSSVVKTIAYTANSISYQTASASGTEKFKVSKIPAQVTAGGTALSQRSDLNQPGWTYNPANNLLEVMHSGAASVQIQF